MHASCAIAFVMLLPSFLKNLKHPLDTFAISAEAQDRAVSPIFEVARVCLPRSLCLLLKIPATIATEDCYVLERIICKVLHNCEFAALT